MNNDFPLKIRAAAVAGWWSTLLAWAIVALQYVAYLYVAGSHPAWFLSLLGPDLDWAYLGRAWFGVTVALKAVIFAMALASTWLTLWERGLRRLTKAPAEVSAKSRTLSGVGAPAPTT